MALCILNVMNSKPSQVKISVRSRLISLVLVSIIPVLIFAGVLASYLTYRSNETVEQSLKGSAKALTTAVDRQVQTVVSTMKVLLELEDFSQGDQYLQSLHRRLQRVVKSQTDWIALSFTDLDGQQFFNTSRPFGEPLPSFKGHPFFEEAVRSGRVVISGHRLGLVTKTKIISIAIPFYDKKVLKHYLIASVESASLSKTLAAQNLTGGRVAAIMDKDGISIGRSKNADKFIGNPATKVLAEESRRKTEDIFHDVNQEGMDSYGAFNRSNYTGWTTAVGLPKEEFTKETWETFLIIVIAAVFFVGLGTYLAFLVGSRISKPILALSDQASALGSGQEIQDIDTNLLEVSQVSEALKKAAADRDVSDKKAQEAVELRDNFLSIASHELKTPITALQLNLQIVQKNVNESEKEKLAKPMERALKQISRLTILVDELLNVSRLTSGKIDFHLEEINLNELLAEMILPYANNQITIEASRTVIGIWDRGRLEQILTNLISNAIKYGENKPILVTIDDSQGRVLIHVKDQGMGIKPEDQARIFERFERAVTHNTISGLGLGLWITNQIIQRMQGSIIVESKIGEGTTFTVSLPLKLSES